MFLSDSRPLDINDWLPHSQFSFSPGVSKFKNKNITIYIEKI